jgi:bifunctional non-homologous end joining protein LigD
MCREYGIDISFQWLMARQSAGERQKNPRTKSSAVGKRSPFPELIMPMLATRITKPFDDKEWIYEVKYDGYRVIGYADGANTKLTSRNGKALTKQFKGVNDRLSRIGHKAVFDGEVVVLNDKGLPDFEKLQNYQSLDPSELLYYVFDILWLDGHSLMDLPLIKRKEMLKRVVDGHDGLVYCDHIEEEGKSLFRSVMDLGLEGIVAKKKDSTYSPDKRVNTWLKIPTEERQEFVIGGWTESDTRAFRSILFGAYKDEKLYYIGHTGGGFKDKEMKSILAKLKKLETRKKPFVNEVETDDKIHWIKPELIAEIKFATWTKSGKIRKPAIFLGFREDKTADQVQAETEMAKEVIEKSSGKDKIKKQEATDSNWPEIEAEKILSRNELVINDRKIELINIEKYLWKPLKVTKADLINYYIQVSDLILPYLIDRAESMHLKPNGAVAPGLYIKDMEGHGPAWLKTWTIDRLKKVKGKRDQIEYLVCNDLPSLVYMINLGCIDINPWLSTIDSADNPDFCLLDLDPSGTHFEDVFEVALVIKQVLDKIKAKAFVKTSGKTGMHICIPLGKKYSYKESLAFAEIIAQEAHKIAPKKITLNRNVSQRGTKVYIDCYQNIKQQTMAAAYSVRPFNAPTVSVPLTWEELNEPFSLYHYNYKRLLERVNAKGYKDPFIGVLGKGIDLIKCLERIRTI